MLCRSLIVVSLFLAESAIAAPLPTDPHFCFMQKSSGEIVNLDRLCKEKEPAPVATPAPTTTTTTTPVRSSGRCTYSTDRDSRGRLCGGRASVRRRGGR